MKDIIGQKIAKVRPLTNKERNDFGFDYGNPMAIILENGLKIVASRDPEGNGPGVFFTDFKGEGTVIG